MRSRLAPAVLVPVLLLAGCSSSESGGAAAGGAADGAAGGAAAVVEPGATLRGVVGEPDAPDAYTITFTDSSGAPVRELPAGDYTIEVEDLSQIHNWALVGEGVDAATSVRDVETASFDVTFAPGEYRYVCDPHPSMTGAFTVV